LSNPRLRVAIVGAGIGRSHARAYREVAERFDLRAICDIDVARAQTVADEFSIQKVVTDIAELCRDDELDVIDICTPPHLHFSHVQQVLESGKHAICEKPLVSSLRDVDELVRIQHHARKWIMPIFQYRFGHGLQKLRWLISEGVAGTAYLTTVETAWRRRAPYYAVPWRGKWATEMGGALLSHAIHTHDMLCYVLGPVRRVFCIATTRVNSIEVEDCATVSLEMADGSVAALGVTLGSPAEVTRHRFSFGNLVAESNTRPYTNSGDPWTFEPDSPDIGEQITAALERFVAAPEGYAGQFHRFYDTLRLGTEPPVTLADARAAIELITAMYFSNETGEAVTLPLGTDHPRYESWVPQYVGLTRQPA
jgi:predicted dehydrogenase